MSRKKKRPEPGPPTDPVELLRWEFPWPVVPGFRHVETEAAFLTADHTRPLAAALASLTGPEPRLVLDVGAGRGLTTEWWCRTCPRALVLAVDHWLGNTSDRLARTMLRDVRSDFEIRCWNLQDRIVPLACSSFEALRRIRELGLRPDVAYFDGSHLEDAVAADVSFVAREFPDALLLGGSWQVPSVRLGVVRGLTELDDTLPGLAIDERVWRHVR